MDKLDMEHINKLIVDLNNEDYPWKENELDQRLRETRKDEGQYCFVQFEDFVVNFRDAQNRYCRYRTDNISDLWVQNGLVYFKYPRKRKTMHSPEEFYYMAARLSKAWLKKKFPSVFSGLEKPKPYTLNDLIEIEKSKKFIQDFATFLKCGT